MSKKRLLQFAALGGLAVFLWPRAISREGLQEVFSYAIAGTLSGIALAWIGGAFASAVVLATAAGSVAAMAGAIWGVMHLARDAFGSWRDERRTPTQLSLREAHR